MKHKIELAKKKVAIAKKAYYDALDTKQEDAAFEALRAARKEVSTLQKQYIDFLIGE